MDAQGVVEFNKNYNPNDTDTFNVTLDGIPINIVPLTHTQARDVCLRELVIIIDHTRVNLVKL